MRHFHSYDSQDDMPKDARRSERKEKTARQAGREVYSREGGNQGVTTGGTRENGNTGQNTANFSSSQTPCTTSVVGLMVVQSLRHACFTPSTGELAASTACAALSAVFEPAREHIPPRVWQR